MNQFADKVAVVTGAGSGFGREFARLGTTLGMRLVRATCSRTRSPRSKRSPFNQRWWRSW
ncbi:hypothetical protein F3J20_29800 [Paraburkholderia sp. Cy-641]|nr:hypothetical protein [Paraburkholderia sp. Cy-641]